MKKTIYTFINLSKPLNNLHKYLYLNYYRKKEASNKER